MGKKSGKTKEPLFKLIFRMLFKVFPNLESSGAMWGLLQTLLAVVFFLFGIP